MIIRKKEKSGWVVKKKYRYDRIDDPSVSLEIKLAFSVISSEQK